MKIEIFQGHDVRTDVKDGQLLFALADICKILDIANIGNVRARLKEAYIHTVDVWSEANNRAYPTTFVNERGLIRVLQTSRSALVEPFQDWADERVEQLMQGKTVNAAGVSEESEDALILRAFTTLQERCNSYKAELAVVRPKAEVFDQVLTAEHTFGFRDLAKALRDRFPINEADLRRVLREKRILTPSGPLDVYSAAIDGGWAVRRPVGSWGKRERFQVRFTNKTLLWLLERLAPVEGLTA